MAWTEIDAVKVFYAFPFFFKDFYDFHCNCRCLLSAHHHTNTPICFGSSWVYHIVWLRLTTSHKVTSFLFSKDYSLGHSHRRLLWHTWARSVCHCTCLLLAHAKTYLFYGTWRWPYVMGSPLIQHRNPKETILPMCCNSSHVNSNLCLLQGYGLPRK